MKKALNWLPSKTKYTCKMEFFAKHGVAELFSCSRCGSVHDYARSIAHCNYLSNYCPHCGAKVENPDYYK